MSKQAFDDFMQKLQQDSALQQELKARFGKPEDGVAAGDLADFAAARGYQFAVNDVSNELDDAALDQVAGGAETFIKYTSTFNTFLKADSLFIKFDGLSYKF